MRALPVVVALLVGIIVSQWAMAPLGEAQVSSPPTQEILKAGAFLLEDANGEIIGGLTTGWRPGIIGQPPRTPTLFLRQDSVAEHGSLT